MADWVQYYQVFLLIIGFFTFVWFFIQLIKCYNKHKYPVLSILAYFYFLPTIFRYLARTIATLHTYELAIQLLYGISLIGKGIAFLSFYYVLKVAEQSDETEFGSSSNPIWMLDISILIIVTSINYSFLLNHLTYGRFYGATVPNYDNEEIVMYLIDFLVFLYIWIASARILIKRKDNFHNPKTKRMNTLLLLGLILHFISGFFFALPSIPYLEFIVFIQLHLIMSIISSVLIGYAVVMDPLVLVKHSKNLQYVYLQDDETGNHALYNFVSPENENIYVKNLPQISLLAESQFRSHSRLLAMDGLIMQTEYFGSYRVILVSHKFHSQYEIDAQKLLVHVQKDSIPIDDEFTMRKLIVSYFQHSL